MSDLMHQDFGVAQSDKQQLPVTVASAATIVPRTRLTFVTGTVAVANITPPTSGYCELLLCFTNAAPALMLTTGNIQFAYQPIQNRPILFCYDPTTAKWWAAATV